MLSCMGGALPALITDCHNLSIAVPILSAQNAEGSISVVLSKPVG